MKQFSLVLKGFCMGIADVIPGVSGGTLALILGVYRELIETIRAVSPAPIFALIAWAKNRTPENLAAFKTSLDPINLRFLAPLGLGIVSAFAIGSIVIPPLITEYPEATRAFFFGLILASVASPFRMLEDGVAKSLPIIVGGIFAGVLVGYLATNPAHSLTFSIDHVQLISQGESLKQLTRRGPSAKSNSEVFWASNNKALRDAVEKNDPQLYGNLNSMRQKDAGLMDKDSQKSRSESYASIQVPAGTPVSIPRLAYWFVFVAGFIAICAMILPGISGSYLLLILGAYFFMLNALKGFIETLVYGAIPSSQAAFVIVFCLGCLTGILSFARLLSFLLREHGAITLSILVGLMVGCLRGVWPFRHQAGNEIVNVLPNSLTSGTISVLMAGIIGFAIVATFTYLGRQRGSEV